MMLKYTIPKHVRQRLPEHRHKMPGDTTAKTAVQIIMFFSIICRFIWVLIIVLATVRKTTARIIVLSEEFSYLLIIVLNHQPISAKYTLRKSFHETPVSFATCSLLHLNLFMSAVKLRNKSTNKFTCFFFALLYSSTNST